MLKPPAAATEPPLPAGRASNDELYVIGLHLDQYRHATRHPEIYWREALRRDPGDARCNNAMGLWHLRRGEFADAEKHFRAAIERLTTRNANPYDEEPHYNLGLTLRYLGRDAEAYDAFYKATWSGKWQAAGFQRLAEIDASSRGLVARRRSCAEISTQGRRQSQRAQSRDDRASEDLSMAGGRSRSRGNACARSARSSAAATSQAAMSRPTRRWRSTLRSITARCGLFDRSDHDPGTRRSNARHRRLRSDGACTRSRRFAPRTVMPTGAERAWTEAAAASSDYCFPNRLEELHRSGGGHRRASQRCARALLSRQFALRAASSQRCYRDVGATPATRSDVSIAWRNLGIAYFNVAGDGAKAHEAFDKAFAANPSDSRVLYERDQLWKRIGERPEARLAELERHLDLASTRDDLSVELASLYNQTRQHEKALAIIRSRKFQPWEGGEGLALGQHVRTHLAFGRRALQQGNAAESRRLFKAALDAPENLGEAKHPLANQSDIYYWLGVALDAQRGRHRPPGKPGSAPQPIAVTFSKCA